MKDLIQRKKFLVQCIDGATGMSLLPKESVKLIYGSPPYPSARLALDSVLTWMKLLDMQEEEEGEE